MLNYSKNKATLYHWLPEQSRVKPVNIFENPPSYSIYVLTLWEERSQDPDNPSVWRFRVEIARTGERHGFATFEELVLFLEEQMQGENETE